MNSESDGKEAESQLSTPVSRLEFAQKAGGVGLWDWDVRTDKTWWSSVLYDLLGLPANVGGTTLQDFFAFVHPDDRLWLDEKLRTALSQKSLYSEEFRVIRADGEERWLAGKGEVFVEDGKAVRMMGINMDVTDRKRTEQQLLELNSTLEQRVEEELAARELLWNVSEDFMVQANYEGKILRTSPSVKRLLRGAFDTVSQLVHRDVIKCANEARAGIRETSQPRLLRNSLQGKHGEIRNLSWSIAAEQNGDTFVAIGRDITAILSAQNRIRETEERLSQVQRMETLGQLASGVAHDFNNLLVPILGVLDLLNRRPQGDPDFDELISGAGKAALNARALVRRILAFSQRQQAEPQSVDVPALLEGMEDLLRNTLPPTISITIDHEDGLAPVRIHPDQLELAVLNLAINARDAMSNEGELTIGCTADGEHIRINVSDTGCGMDEEVARRATEAFFTTKGAGKGTGLGLFMAQRLAQQTGGSLEINSTPGVGTMVTLVVPALA